MAKWESARNPAIGGHLFSQNVVYEQPLANQAIVGWDYGVIKSNISDVAVD